MLDSIECAFAGVVGRAPELRQSKSGKPWANFPVVVGKDDAAQWVKVAVFSEVAEALCGTLHKGTRVYVEGRLSVSIWQPEDGAPRANVDVAAYKVELLGQIGKRRPRRDAGHGGDRRDDGRTTAPARQYEPALDDGPF